MDNKMIYIYIAIIDGITVLGIIVAIFNSKKAKNNALKYEKEHPEAAKVYLSTKALIISEAVSIYTVNGEYPTLFHEKGNGFYALLGTNEFQISYTYQRPGVMYRNITKTYGPVKMDFEIEANKSYQLVFNRKKEEFTFEEIV